MAISFQTLKEPEFVDISGIAIRKRGCLTVAEEEAIRNLGAILEDELRDLTALQSDLKLKQLVATILIKSRLDRQWTLEKTQAPEWEIEISGNALIIEPDMELLEGLYTFFMGEQRRWQEPKAADEVEQSAQKKKSTGTKSAGG